MSKEFYCVNMDWGHDFYFRSLEHAREFLWKMYCDYYANESEQEQQSALIEMIEHFLIQGVGYIYVYEFED